MNQLVSALLDELEGRELDAIKEVRIEVGELTFLGEEQMKFAYETLSRDTILEGSELNIDSIPSKIRCEECGYEGSVNYSDGGYAHYNIPVINCPECDSKPEIVKGKETKIVGVTAVEE
ncbi:MAG: hydrogenase maturation nickel metallochaperone HypA [Candidatus Thermoplasmatota archaeon]|nr:hydrogenase maturation nickel metallochaperone HypA [Candidatus Thermoplasmatota archaeon]